MFAAVRSSRRPRSTFEYPRTRAIAALFALLAAGCGGARTPAPVTPEANDSAWFCQMATQEGWECVQDATLVASPKPARLPIAPIDGAPANEEPMARDAPMTPAIAAPPPLAQARAPSERVRSPDTPIQAAQPQRPAAQPIQPAPTTTSGHSEELPAYQRLAYRPDKPTQLADLPPDFLAVQLVAVTSKEALEEFVKQHQLVGMSAARIAKDNRIYYVLLLGVYPDTKSAELAAAERPPPLRDVTPWIRPVGQLQEAMRAADAVTGSTEF